MKIKNLGIGYENYKNLIDEDRYYVDKTFLAKDILEKGGKVTLFTRPRRFGKTLALSMLRTFFELEYDAEGNQIDNSKYFNGMKIMDAGEDILSNMGKYPVISLSLKSAKQPDFETAFLKLREEIVNEFVRHDYVCSSDKVSENGRAMFTSLKNGIIDWEEKEKQFKSKEDRESALKVEVGKYSTSIKTLSSVLKEYHGRNVVILIDEYDVPLENAYFRGFYDEMISFVRSLFESAFKTNDALERAVITGCLRISKESIFTGLNNLEIISVRSRNFGEYFGFTQEETDNLLKAYDLSENVGIVRDWYDGYLFGECEVYNPWSLIKYVSEHHGAPLRFPEPYWSNTSFNSIIKDLVERADESVRVELDEIISGKTIEKRVHEDITYDDIDKSEDNLWNFLFFTGYMKKVSERQIDDDIYVTMAIPNREIRSIYRNQIREWFNSEVKKEDFTPLYDAIRNREAKVIEDFISGVLSKSISVFDSDESFYHGFFLSLMYGMPGYTARSNREEGNGRPDVSMYPDRPKEPAYIFEIKARKKFNEMDNGIKEAFNQIRQKKYVEGILDDGYAGAVAFGICFCKKSCVVEMYHDTKED